MGKKKDPEVMAVPSVATEQSGLSSAARKALDDFDAEADRQSNRYTYRTWLNNAHEQRFDGELPPDGVPDLLVRLRIAYAITKEAVDAEGGRMSPRFEQNYKAAMALDESQFTSGMRAMVEAQLGSESKEMIDMATKKNEKLNGSKGHKATKGGANPGTRAKPQGIGAFIRERIQAGDDTQAILAKVAKKFPESRSKPSDISWNRRKLMLDSGEKPAKKSAKKAAAPKKAAVKAKTPRKPKAKKADAETGFAAAE